LALLATKDGLKSESVTKEWDTALIMQRRITPVALSLCDVDDLPRRMQPLQMMDWNSLKPTPDECWS